MTHIARSLASIVDTDHERAVEAASPAGVAIRVSDDGHGVNSLECTGQGTAT